MTQSQAYEDEQFVWTPANNQSIKNYEKAEDLFDVDEKQRVISIIAESSDASDNLLTLDAFREMIDYQKMLYEISEFKETTMDDDTREPVRPKEGEKVTFVDFCRMIPLTTKDNTIVRKCFNSGQPIEYIYELATNSYPLEKYSTNEELLDKIKLGKSDPEYIILTA